MCIVFHMYAYMYMYTVYCIYGKKHKCKTPEYAIITYEWAHVQISFIVPLVRTDNLCYIVII